MHRPRPPRCCSEEVRRITSRCLQHRLIMNLMVLRVLWHRTLTRGQGALETSPSVVRGGGDLRVVCGAHHGYERRGREGGGCDGGENEQEERCGAWHTHHSPPKQKWGRLGIPRQKKRTVTPSHKRTESSFSLSQLHLKICQLDRNPNVKCVLQIANNRKTDRGKRPF